jgi:hypothetical protein
MQDASIQWRLGVFGISLLAAAATLSGRQLPVWREAPEYLPLFAPRSHRELYRASVSSSGLDDVLASMADDPRLLRTPGGWEARSAGPWDAFGKSGEYDRFKLARLYGARRARVARGPRIEEGRVVETWTLVSPYPSPSLDRLEPGTLRIVLRLPENE